MKLAEFFLAACSKIEVRIPHTPPPFKTTPGTVIRNNIHPLPSGGARDFSQRGQNWPAGALRRSTYPEPQHDLSHDFETFHLVFLT